MKALFKLMTCCFIVLSGISCKNLSQKSTIVGNIEGLDNDTIMIAIWPVSRSSKSQIDTFISHNGKFSLNREVEELYSGRIISNNMWFKLENGQPLWMRSKIVNFFLGPNEKIKINGILNEYTLDYLVSGSPINEQSSSFRKQQLPLLENETKTYIELKNLQYNKGDTDLIASKRKEFDEIRENYNQYRIDYLKQHPNQEISAYFLNMQDENTILKLQSILQPNAWSSVYGEILKQRIEIWRATTPGEQAPLFSGVTINGKNFNLKELRGKYVVLDFWGSWCGPCIQGIPEMKKYYEKYNDRIEFVSIACKDNRDKWEKTIEENSMNWIHIFNDTSKGEDISIKYGIQAYPTKIVIDKSGKIVQKFEGEEPGFYKKLDAIFSKQP